jgi:peptidoglycan hydrolase-like protein with peptidoglycan-binding domain
MEVQRALAAKGYNPGPIDGQLGRQTVSAMQKFQADNGLPQGQPSVEAVQMLGVPLVPLNRN